MDAAEAIGQCQVFYCHTSVDFFGDRSPINLKLVFCWTEWPSKSPRSKLSQHTRLWDYRQPQGTGFTTGDGVQVRFLMPAQQALYPLGHLPNPIFMALIVFSDQWKVFFLMISLFWDCFSNPLLHRWQDGLMYLLLKLHGFAFHNYALDPSVFFFNYISAVFI